MENITIGGQYYDKVFGGGLPGPIWKDAMTGALDGQRAPGLQPRHIPSRPTGDRDDGDGQRRPSKPGKPAATATATGEQRRRRSHRRRHAAATPSRPRRLDPGRT